MTYLGVNGVGYNITPAMDRVSSLLSSGTHCTVDVFNSTFLSSTRRRFVGDFAADPAIDVGFRARSMRFISS